LAASNMPGVAAPGALRPYCRPKVMTPP
jgi:hypothetical protein